MRHFYFGIRSPYYPNIVNNPINLDCCNKINKSKSTSSQLPGPTFNQSIHQSTNKSINQWIHHSFDQSLDQSIGQSIDKINRSTNKSIDKSNDQGIDQPIGQPINQSIDQWVNQSQPFQNKNLKLYRKLAKKEKHWKKFDYFFSLCHPQETHECPQKFQLFRYSRLTGYREHIVSLGKKFVNDR